MWISNTATAAMMLPIAHAVLEEIREENQIRNSSTKHGCNTLTTVKYTKNYNSTLGDSSELDHEVDEHFAKMQDNTSECGEDESTFSGGVNERDWIEKSTESTTYTQEFQDRVEIVPDSSVSILEDKDGGVEDEGNVAINERVEVITSPGSPRPGTANAEMRSTDKSYTKMTKCLMLGVAYSANIGGTATLTGTGPNIVLSGLARSVAQGGHLPECIYVACACNPHSLPL